MACITYDMKKLAENNGLDTAVVSMFFYNPAQYYDKLTAYMCEYPQYLHNYNPTVVVVSAEERKVFIEDCANIRATLTQLGMTMALNELNNMENAVLAGTIKELADGLTKFHATLKIYATKIENAKEDEPHRLPSVLAVVSSLDRIKSLAALTEGYCTVTAVTTWDDAVAALSGHDTPACFLLSTIMPDINGYALAFLIREQARFNNSPIFFLTIHEMPIDRLRLALPHLEEYFITLPVTQQEQLSFMLSKLQR